MKLTSKPQIKNKSKKAKSKKPEQQVPITQKPNNMSADQWQTALREQIAKTQSLAITNIGNAVVYSDYLVVNPLTKGEYKVALRSLDNTRNYCSCKDFMTNQLGTCKHIEAVRNKIRNTRALSKFLKHEEELPYTSIYLNYKGERRVMTRIGIDNKAEFETLFSVYFDSDFILTDYGFDHIDELLEKAYSISSEFRCYDDALQFIISHRQREERNKYINNYVCKSELQLGRGNGGNVKGFPQIEGLKINLFPYQQEGVLFAFQSGRSILADDMGLGKTVQAIAWAEMMKTEVKSSSVLIVCPTSLKYQWKTEIEKFTNSSVLVIEGNPLKRWDLYQNDNSYYKIVSYNVVSSDWKVMNKNPSDIIILDEAQRIKNWKTKISQNVKRLQSTYSLILTGTPLENNLEDLFSLSQFVDPYILGSLYNYLSKHQIKDERGKITGYQELHQIAEVMKDVMIRRTKKQVLSQLPERTDKVLFVPLTPEQRAIHDEYKNSLAQLIYKWQRQRFLSEQDRQRLMIFMNSMRMVCDSTYILDQKTNFQTKIDELFNILDEVIAEGEEKIVIFSQWERMTRLVAMKLDERNVKYEYLHGGVSSIKRKDLYQNFNNDADCRVFLSTDAGGVGLNLQAASILINLDIPWNPAVLEQRISRIHRLGQKRNVQIINLVSANTIEERMLAVLRFKGAMAAGVLDNGENNIFIGESRFQQFMHDMEEMIIEKEGEAFVEAENTEFEENKEVKTDIPQEVEAVKTQKELAQEEGNEQEETQVPDDKQSEVIAPSELISNGLNFFTQLTKTLSDPTATANLINSITETDKETGNTYIKIPVENKEVVSNAMKIFGSLFSALK